jgi:hypothetical protein
VFEQRDAARVNQNLVRSTNIILFLGALTATFALVACGGGSAAPQSVPPPPVTFTANSGVAQKGALIAYSTRW